MLYGKVSNFNFNLIRWISKKKDNDTKLNLKKIRDIREQIEQIQQNKTSIKVSQGSIIAYDWLLLMIWFGLKSPLKM